MRQILISQAQIVGHYILIETEITDYGTITISQKTMSPHTKMNFLSRKCTFCSCNYQYLLFHKEKFNFIYNINNHVVSVSPLFQKDSVWEFGSCKSLGVVRSERGSRQTPLFLHLTARLSVCVFLAFLYVFHLEHEKRLKVVCFLKPVSLYLKTWIVLKKFLFYTQGK